MNLLDEQTLRARKRGVLPTQSWRAKWLYVRDIWIWVCDGIYLQTLETNHSPFIFPWLRGECSPVNLYIAKWPSNSRFWNSYEMMKKAFHRFIESGNELVSSKKTKLAFQKRFDRAGKGNHVAPVINIHLIINPSHIYLFKICIYGWFFMQNNPGFYLG